MIAEIQAGYESAKTLFEVAKGALTLKNEAAINGAILDIQRLALDTQKSLFDANEAYAARLKEIEKLKEQLAALTAWSVDADRYELRRFQPGTLTYVLKVGAQGGEPPHYLCANCYENQRRSILQATSYRELQCRVHRCNCCKAEYPIGPEMPYGSLKSEMQGSDLP
jgi:hypothetical protein